MLRGQLKREDGIIGLEYCGEHRSGVAFSNCPTIGQAFLTGEFLAVGKAYRHIVARMAQEVSLGQKARE